MLLMVLTSRERPRIRKKQRWAPARILLTGLGLPKEKRDFFHA